MNGYLDSYLGLALLMLAGVLVVTGAYGANRVLSPSRPGVGPGKFDTYECGLDPVEGGWAQLHIRYYIYAYLYVLFAVEAVFLFPWAVVYVSAGMVAVAEMAIFVGVLALGLLYAWRKNALTWQ